MSDWELVLPEEPDNRHYLVVNSLATEDSDALYIVEHPATCPAKNFGYYVDYDCGEAYHIRECGIDDLVADIKKPGRYPFQYWSHKTPSSVYGGEEWDAGLEWLEDIDSPNTTQQEHTT